MISLVDALCDKRQSKKWYEGTSSTLLEETQCQGDSVLCTWEAVLTPPCEHSRVTHSLQVNPSQSLSLQRQGEVKRLRKSWLAPQKMPHLVLILALLSGVFQTDRCTARSVVSTRILSPQCQRLSFHFPFLQALKGHCLHHTCYTITKLAPYDLQMIA